MVSEAMSVSQLISVVAPGFLFVFLLQDKFKIAMNVVMAAFGKAGSDYASAAGTISVIFVALGAGLLLRSVTFCELVIAMRVQRYLRQDRQIRHFWKDVFGTSDSTNWGKRISQEIGDKTYESVKSLSDIHQTMGGFIIVLTGGLLRMLFKWQPEGLAENTVPHGFAYPDPVYFNEMVVKMNELSQKLDFLYASQGRMAPKIAFNLPDTFTAGGGVDQNSVFETLNVADQAAINAGQTVGAALGRVLSDQGMLVQYLVVGGLLASSILAAWLSFTALTRLLASSMGPQQSASVQAS